MCKRLPHTKKFKCRFFFVLMGVVMTLSNIMIKFFAKIVNSEKLLTILAKMFHPRSMAGSYILFRTRNEYKDFCK